MNLASRLQHDGYFEALACHLVGLLAPRFKVSSCLDTLSLGFIGPLCGEQSKLRLGNAVTSLEQQEGGRIKAENRPLSQAIRRLFRAA